jgi:hypothetical protein
MVEVDGMVVCIASHRTHDHPKLAGASFTPTPSPLTSIQLDI